MLTKNLFPLTNEKSWQSLLIKDGRLSLINARYKTEDDFAAAYEKKSIFRKKKEALVQNITRLAHPESNPKRLNVEATTGKFFLDFTNTADLEEVTDYLKEQRHFTAETKSISKFRAITPSLIGLAFTAGFTWAVWMDAVAIEEGEILEEWHGRGRLVGMLLAWLGEKLGSRNTLIAGVVIGIIFLYFMFKALQNPPNEVVYS